MLIVFTKDHTLLGRLRRPGELLEVNEETGRELILAKIAQERKAKVGPDETKEPEETPDDPDA